MAARKGIECPPWKPRSKLSSDHVQLHLSGSLYTLDKKLLALKSAHVSKLLQKHTHEDISILLRDSPADQESMELVSRFCQGYEITLSTQNVVRVACIAQYLGMTDSHCANNLLSRAASFFEQQVLTSWSNSIKALKSAENVLQQASDLGLVDYCIESIISKVLENPRLLGEPIKNNLNTSDDDDDYGSDENENENVYKPNARRKLFDIDWKSEDLTSLSLRLYAPIIRLMIERQVPQEYIATNLCQYAKTWLFEKIGEDMPTYKMNTQREIVETLVTLLPHQKNIVSCAFLFEMLKFAIVFDASAKCRNELELRIGKQLDGATVNDLLIPSQGYAKDEKYDTECIRRILKNFYCNYAGLEPTPLNSVAELIDEFLAEISADVDLKTSTFLEIADMSLAVSAGGPRTSDGIYRAIDICLDKHKHLTESEREKICRVLDCNKLSAEACEHAAQNERLPVRVVVQVLFVAQLKLREAIPSHKEERNEEGLVKAEIEKMGSKMMELEKECGVMKREMERGGGGCGVGVKRKKVSMWREMKRKLGCVTMSMQDCNCHVKKKKIHPRKGEP